MCESFSSYRFRVKSSLVLLFLFVQEMSRENVQENITAGGVLRPSSGEMMLNQQTIFFFVMKNIQTAQKRKLFYKIRKVRVSVTHKADERRILFKKVIYKKQTKSHNKKLHSMKQFERCNYQFGSINLQSY